MWVSTQERIVLGTMWSFAHTSIGLLTKEKRLLGTEASRLAGKNTGSVVPRTRALIPSLSVPYSSHD